MPKSHRTMQAAPLRHNLPPSTIGRLRFPYQQAKETTMPEVEIDTPARATW